MLETLQFLSLPLTACFVLVVIHGYFGLHVLSRGVIFVDISMGQIAALGTLVGILLGVGAEGVFSYLISFLFVLAAALIFTFVKLEHRDVPQEAIIGIVYGLSFALSLVVAGYVPNGSGFIKETLSGALLWVNWGTIFLCGLVYAAIGAFHYVFREKFIALSEKNPELAVSRAGLWDFLFYSTLGLVIVYAVKIVGVFMVFTLLVVPAAIAVIFFETWKARLIASWIVGLLLCTAGTLLSYGYNLPNGPSIVCLLGLALIAASLAKSLFFRDRVAETPECGAIELTKEGKI